MIAKGNAHNSGSKLADYLMTGGKHGERAELAELRGFGTALDIKEAFRNVHVMAEGTKAEKPLFHVQVRLPDGEKLSRAQWQETADRIERMLGLTDQPRAVVFHFDKKTGEEHMHLAWSRINAQTLTAIPMPFYKERLIKISRELELHFGLQQVTSQRESEIEFAPTKAEDEQARRAGVDIHKIRETIRACYDRDGGAGKRGHFGREKGTSGVVAPWPSWWGGDGAISGGAAVRWSWIPVLSPFRRGRICL